GATAAEAAVGLESAGRQIRRLLQMAMMAVFVLGSWMIWSRVLPALAIFRTIELWPHPFRMLETADLENTTGVLTLAGLALAALIGAFTWFLEHTLPELIDMLLLRRTRLDAGGRYAVAAVCRYSVLVAGVLAAFNQLGIGWSQLNWLVAAMTVGLGFGLQEIFANFVSGLILLFERPVRIGDIVSIGDVTGTVSRIRMRATTITDGDLRELLVPNKELITGRVINWTLTNTLSRLTLKVRVAVGTDPDFARGLLLSVAGRHPTVLKQPPPQAQFEDFADNALNLSLRVCVASCDVSAQVRHELLTAIKREFQEAGIATAVGAGPAAKSPSGSLALSPGFEDKRSLSESLPRPHTSLRSQGSTELSRSPPT
ncbi:MAG: potassium transporter KefA, partial [Planctomycetaceae bacterium]